jgi:hypothetical protein
MKARYIALTDIYDEKRFMQEVDDIESMVRLLLYSNEIDLEGLIPCTSFGYQKGAAQKNLDVIFNIISAYEKVKPNLDVHAPGYPEPGYLRSLVCAGIPVYGKKYGKGFGEEQYNDNPGVNRIIAAADKKDDRPLWIGLWGGANTLAQAVWKVWKTRSEAQFNIFLSKLRIYGISDQDLGGRWMRKMFGDRLFYIVTPSKGTLIGAAGFMYAAWPGISSDNFSLGSEDGKKGGGFKGARTDLISPKWLTENIVNRGVYGSYYPLPHFSMEGDTPSYLGLIPNGLNDPERPDYGGWGGRYRFYKPEKSQFKVEEKFPLWTNASDTVLGVDGKPHTSPQATIWRWREAFQNDFAARMAWAMAANYKDTNHPPLVKLSHPKRLSVRGGAYVSLDASPSSDPDGNSLSFNWYHYREAGNYDGELVIDHHTEAEAGFKAPFAPEGGSSLALHIICEVKDGGKPSLIRYERVIVSVMGQSE